MLTDVALIASSVPYVPVGVLSLPLLDSTPETATLRADDDVRIETSTERHRNRNEYDHDLPINRFQGAIANKKNEKTKFKFFCVRVL